MFRMCRRQPTIDGGWCLLAWVAALVVAIRNPTTEART